MHRKRVTSELHDSYFRLTTIQHSIPNIKWATEWALNYYITQSRQKFQLEIGRSYRRDVVRKATSGRRGLGALMNLGPGKLLIRCSKESHHPAEWTLGRPVEHQENENDTTLTAIGVGVKILQFMFGIQLPLTVKTHTTFSNPYK